MEYISHEDYKKMMENFSKGTPKQSLNESIEEASAVTKKPAAHLKAGDVLTSGATVIRGAQAGARTPSGKVDLVVRYPNGKESLVVWGKTTMIGVRNSAEPSEGLEKEGNAFTAGLAKAKKGEEFKVGDKTFKDKTNYDAPIKEEEGEAKVLDYEGGSTYKIQSPSGKVVEVDFEAHYEEEIDPPYVWAGWITGTDGEYEYDMDCAFVDAGGSDDWEADYSSLQAEPVRKKVDEYQFDQMYPDDPGPFEGKDVDKMIKEFLLKEDDVNWDRMDDEEAEEDETDNGIEEDFNPDSSDFEQAITKELQYLGDEELTDVEYEQALKALENPKVIDKLWGVHPKKAASALAKMVRGKEVGEGLNPAPFQATGPTIQTVEGKKNKFAHLTSEERDQLRQYVETIRTVKEQIKKMTNKSEMEEGGDMTNLVMKPTTMSEDGEVDAHEEVESKIDPKLHDTFHKVLDMVTKQLLDAGFEESQVQEFLKHEVSELPNFVTSQYESK